MADILMYSRQYCGYCIRAKRLLKAKGASYQEISIDGSSKKRTEMIEKSNRRTVPQIWINGDHVGGFTELYQLEKSGTLDDLLASDNKE